MPVELKGSCLVRTLKNLGLIAVGVVGGVVMAEVLRIPCSPAIGIAGGVFVQIMTAGHGFLTAGKRK